jgi:hypothetical protein
MGINSYDDQFAANVFPLVADGFGTAPTIVSISSDSFGGSTLTLFGSFPAGGSNAYVGLTFAVAGYSTNGQNNGYWVCTASSTTSIDLTVPGGAGGASTTAVKVAITANKWFKKAPTNDFSGGSVFYAFNPTVGANHYFLEDDRTINNAGDGSSFAVAAFSGMKTSSDPFVQDTIGTQVSSGTTVQANSLTPTTHNLVLTLVTGLNLTGPEAVDSGFTVTDSYQTGSGRYSPIGMAYLVAPNASALQPTWTLGAIGNRAYATQYEFAHA